MPYPTQPFSVPDPLADDWDDMLRRSRMLQAGNDPYFGAPPHGADGSDDDVSTALNQAQMPIADWQAMRAQQLAARQAGDDAIFARSGQDVLQGGAGSDTISAAGPPRQKLTGRPGTAALVAGALNTIAGAPNTSAPVPGGVLRRGAGSAVRGDASILGRHLGAHGFLDPPTGKPEVSVSGLEGEGVILPSHVRVFNTPSGELDIELPAAVKLNRYVTLRPKGTYSIP